MEAGGCNTGDIKISGSSVFISFLTGKENCLKLYAMEGRKGRKGNFKDIWGYERKWHKNTLFLCHFILILIYKYQENTMDSCDLRPGTIPFSLSSKPPTRIQSAHTKS